MSKVKQRKSNVIFTFHVCRFTCDLSPYVLRSKIDNKNYVGYTKDFKKD